MIRVLLLSPPRPDVFQNIGYGVPEREPVRFGIRLIGFAEDLESEIAQFRPHVILTFLAEGAPCPLNLFPADIRRRWVNLPFGVDDGQNAIRVIMSLYFDVVRHRQLRREPTLSVITPTFNTGPVLLRAYNSLRQQTYRNWEWVIYDDSTEPDTLDLVNLLARSDSRVKVVRSGAHSGWIGEVKRRAFRAAEGDVLVELDHDDELTHDCLELLAEGFTAHPECGFAYTDFAEVNPDGTPLRYGETFAFGYGSYYPTTYQGRHYQVARSAAINTTTMRHIVGVPNHVRAWTREAYDACGGHSPDVYVADDYELLVRTFLGTRMMHVAHFGYIQHRSDGRSNTHIVRNAEIQRQVWIFSSGYAQEIDTRAREIAGPEVSEIEGVPLHVEYRSSKSVVADVA